MKTVIPENLRNKKGHYVPGVISRGMLYISGQLPIDPEKGTVVDGGIPEQMKMVLANMENVLKAAGLTREKVVQCRIYISDIAYWDQVDAVYSEFFGDHKPARAVVPTRDLHFGALVELEAIAEAEEEK